MLCDAANGRLDPKALVNVLVDLIRTREAHDKHYGTVVLAEGLAELLPDEEVAHLPRESTATSRSAASISGASWRAAWPRNTSS